MSDPVDDIGRKELLKSAYRKIEELRARLTASEGRLHEPVAVVGMGCRFPGGATDADSYWELLSSGRDGVTEIPPDRWNVDEYYDADPDAPGGKMYARRGGFIGDVRGFDPLFFHLSPQEASSMDPQQRVLLEVAWEALENTGIAPDRISGTRTGVFVGVAGCEYNMLIAMKANELVDSAHIATGGSHSIAAGRISYFFGLRGPCMAVDTACASALTSIHLAVQSLRTGESRMALAGSVSLILSPGAHIALCKARMLAADGKCKTFDAAADGYVRSEGCGVLVLKLLSQAQADHDRILAVIRGTACNQDGRTNGITAPNGNAQREVILAALADAGVSSGDIDYVETHGTGTSLGDPIEMQALGEVFAPDRPANRNLILGAVKTNIGHLELSAGIAAIAKVVLALQREQIPPNLHLHNPNPLLSLESLPFSLPTELTPWPPGGNRRLAGVSAFGFSGTNVHMVLEQAPRAEPLAAEDNQPCHLFTLSAQTPKALTELTERYVAFLTSNPAANLADICFTANTGRAHFTHRIALVASSIDQLKSQLQSSVQRIDGVDSPHKGRAPVHPPQMGLFIGVESLSDVHRQLYHRSPPFKIAIDACDAAANDLFGTSLPASIWQNVTPELPTDLPSKTGKILSFALTYAMAVQWREWGLNAGAVSGHDAGRYVGAAFVGAMSLHDAIRLAIDPTAADHGNAITWTPPQTVLLSPLTGLPLTSDFSKEPAESAPINATIDSDRLLAGFKREGTGVLFTIGASCNDAAISRRLASNAEFIRIPACSDSWLALLNVFAALYTTGISINFDTLESPSHRQRLALPNYPFQHQDCWLKLKPGGAERKSLQKDLHPLLGRRVYSPQLRDEVVFEAEFDTERLPFLKDHRIFSTVVVPASAMLEMGNAAGRILFSQSRISIDDLVIEQPFLLADGPTSLVQTVLTPQGPGKYSFVILSAEFDKLQESSPWRRHCSGVLTALPASSAAVADPRNLQRLQSRLRDAVDPEQFYSTLTELGVEYGSSFRVLRSICRGPGGSLAFVKLSPDASRQAAEFGAFPGLLDAAMQILGSAYVSHPGKVDGGDIYLPVGVESCRLSMPRIDELWCHATIRSSDETMEQFVGDLQFYSTTGLAIGELRGVQFNRNAKKQYVQEMVERRLTHWLFEPRWEPIAPLPPADHLKGTWLVVAHRNPVADEFATVVRQRDGRAIIVRPGAQYSRQDGDNFTSRFSSSGDVDQLIRAATASCGRLEGVVHFAARPAAEDGSEQSIPQSAASMTEQLLHLTGALARNGAGDLAALALVTEGFAVPSIGAGSGVIDSAAWGLGRTIAAELPDLHCKLIDLAPSLSPRRAAELLADELGSGSDENQLTLSDGTRMALRLAHADASILGRNNSLSVDPRQATRSRLEPSGTYLVTGGLGGLGLLVARWMVNEGARRIVLVGRGAPNPAAEKVIGELESLGAHVVVARADIGDRQQVADLLTAHTSSSSPLRGVIHAAGVLDDGALLLQDWQRFGRVLKPKIQGAWNLHELTLDMPLDFFVLFSSAAGLFGNPGQSSYAAGNVFLDQLAIARRAAGLPALSINWGAWAEVGMAAAMIDRQAGGWDSRAMPTIEPAQGIAILQMLMAGNQIAQIAVLPVGESAWGIPAGHVVPPLIRNLIDGGGADSATALPDNGQAAERLRDAAPGERRKLMIELVHEIVLDVFGVDRRGSIAPDQNLTTLGMDSLLAIQLSNRLKKSFAAAVPATLTFQYPTIEAISDYLLETLSDAKAQSEPAQAAGTEKLASATVQSITGSDAAGATAVLASLDQLSDNEVDALLKTMACEADSV